MKETQGHEELVPKKSIFLKRNIKLLTADDEDDVCAGFDSGVLLVSVKDRKKYISWDDDDQDACYIHISDTHTILKKNGDNSFLFGIYFFPTILPGPSTFLLE